MFRPKKYEYACVCINTVLTKAPIEILSTDWLIAFFIISNKKMLNDKKHAKIMFVPTCKHGSYHFIELVF